MKPTSLAMAAGLMAWAHLACAPALACLSCGCGGSGTSSDLGAVGGAASIFSMGSRWLIQEGVSTRSITGAFNELGTWNPTPVGGSLTSVQSTLGLTYFPMMGASIGLQVPLVANALDGATWGPMGSINPTDTPRAVGAAIGDLAFQASYKVAEGPSWALAAWGGASAPTGQATGDPALLSGAGVWSGMAGMIGVTQLNGWEFSGNLGYQRPFGQPPLTASTFYVGEAWLYQLQSNVAVTDAVRVGLGLNGFLGQGRFGPTDLAVPMSKIKVVPSVQYQFGAAEGVRLALGYDPASLGKNSMTDLTLYAIFYQFMQ
ncbi:hypothetical protein D3C72_376550 [compost metagenome]